MSHGDGRHLPQVFVQESGDLLRLEPLAQLAEAVHVDEEGRHLAPLEALGGQAAGEQGIDHGLGQEALELAAADELGHLLIHPGLQPPVELGQLALLGAGPQQASHAGQQFPLVEGLRKVVVGAGIEGLDAGFGARTGGQEDDRRRAERGVIAELVLRAGRGRPGAAS